MYKLWRPLSDVFSDAMSGPCPMFKVRMKVSDPYKSLSSPTVSRSLAGSDSEGNLPSSSRSSYISTTSRANTLQFFEVFYFGPFADVSAVYPLFRGSHPFPDLGAHSPRLVDSRAAML
jgi:hypothetical protein